MNWKHTETENPGNTEVVTCQSQGGPAPKAYSAKWSILVQTDYNLLNEH